MSSHTLNLSNLPHEAAAFLDNHYDGMAMPTRTASRTKQKKSFSFPNLLDSAISYLSQQYLSLDSEGL